MKLLIAKVKGQPSSTLRTMLQIPSGEQTDASFARTAEHE